MKLTDSEKIGIALICLAVFAAIVELVVKLHFVIKFW